jgi:23S rRNA pseudouridine1911/1915/1917 synthase
MGLCRAPPLMLRDLARRTWGIVKADRSAASQVVETAVGPDDAGARLDRFLAGRVPSLSRTRLKHLILAGAVRMASRPVEDPGHRLKAGDRITLRVPPPAPAKPAAEAIALRVVHEDADVIVIDKPAGLVVHPAAGNRTGTLVNALLAHCGDSLSGIGGEKRPGIVHRLDKDTSGLLVAAKTDRAHRALAAQFADHGRSGDLERAYLALVWSVPKPAQGTIDAPIGRDPRSRVRMAVRTGGRRAVTHFAVRATYNGADGKPIASLVECRLETGRTHQIRVHMARLGHPLLGDSVYGAGFRSKEGRLPATVRAAVAALGRQALHAYRLGFSHPATGKFLAFDSKLPADLAAVVKAFTTQ